MSTQHPLAIHNPTDGQYDVMILSRWVRELRAERRQLHAENERLAATITELEHQVSGFAFWMRTAKTPARIKQLAEAVG